MAAPQQLPYDPKNLTNEEKNEKNALEHARKMAGTGKGQFSDSERIRLSVLLDKEGRATSPSPSE